MPALPFLPNEIWFRIADLIELNDRHLHGIIGMNRPFFELAMDKLYRKVRLTDGREDSVFLDKMIGNLLGFRGLVKELFFPSIPSPEEQTERLFHALSCLRHLEELTFQDGPSYDLHNASERWNSFLFTLTPLLWRTIGENLSTLDVGVWSLGPRLAETLLHSPGLFSKVTHLKLHLHWYNLVTPTAPFLSFIDSLCPAVESLMVVVVNSNHASAFYVDDPLLADSEFVTQSNFKVRAVMVHDDTNHCLKWKCLERLLQNNPKIQEPQIRNSYAYICWM
ncbi:uncharacterized protein LACBIDRAFT_329198 [Laccaria bicolor S238N-H82]|uniref:Predicted protein n=1 Tax=Laccaria bicolor (strain S238N-H82 / ATCC MYA-4686) TaxID=486041 RepID=B0DHC8_LACBS|nr:uncharacterized protein LACBIDRAFT_329198 [Laccaria bicolor S238N-H82]EDR05991.1 predicted protein [Laccaria bicolor S238N-H82]|eukprot:XP_001883279.1 predicted protein [Laccaria bicolor S238N-H82]